MPKLSGPEVIERLDHTSFDGDVIVSSAYRPDSHRGADDAAAYLNKPISRDDLPEHLAQYD